ncbi:amidase [Seohaeicola saemankumensis]|uniref:amidase n=1 Tax=Seohaeicola saemankumensis TaxID=481181 RepID=UPI0035D12BFB
MIISDQFAGLDTIDLAKLVERREATALEITDAVINRVEALNPVLNFMTSCDFDRARDRARNARTATPFAGVPFLMKDMIDVGGLPRTDGSRLMLQNVPQQNVAYVDAIEDAGLNILGLTNVPEFAAGITTDNAVFGATKNPLNPEYSVFSSSGGSAAAVASGVVSMAHGTDGGGSNRLPASATGIFGMKPSRGRMHSGEAGGGHDIAKTNHVLSRTVRESALLFSLTENKAGALRPVGYVAAPCADRLRIGYVSSIGPVDEDVTTALTRTRDLLSSMGHTLVKVKFPVNLDEFTNAYTAFFSTRLTLLRQMVEASTGKPIGDSGLVTPFVASGAEALRDLSEGQIERAMLYLHSLQDLFEQLFQEVDILLTPVSPVVCPKLDQDAWNRTWNEDLAAEMVMHLQYTAPINFAGCPAMSVPCAIGSNTGMPVGSHLIAPIGGERRLFELAYELEAELQPMNQLDCMLRLQWASLTS